MPTKPKLDHSDVSESGELDASRAGSSYRLTFPPTGSEAVVQELLSDAAIGAIEDLIAQIAGDQSVPRLQRLETIRSILEHEGLTWTDVVKVTRYLTDMRDMDELNVVMNGYFGDWKPASTTICVNQLSTPGARVELEMTAVFSSN